MTRPLSLSRRVFIMITSKAAAWAAWDAARSASGLWQLALALLACVSGFAALAGAFGSGLSLDLGIVSLRTHGMLRPWILFMLAGAAALFVGARPRTALDRASGQTPAPAPPRAFRQLRRALWIALPVVSALLALVALLQASGPAYPVSDHAILEVYVLHVLRGAWLLGPYSQYSWNHPGPIYFYLLAPLYAASGGKTLALNATVWLLNAGCGALIVWVILRRLPPRARVPMLVVLGLYAARIQPLFASPWNPHVLVLPLLALLFVTGLAAAGRVRALLPLVLVASFLAQTHVGLVPVAGLIAAAALASALLAARQGQASPAASAAPAQPPLLPWINRGAWLLALLWLPPIAEQLAAPQGNMTELYAFFVKHPSPRFGWIPAAPVWASLVNGLVLPGLKMPAGGPFVYTPSLVSIGAALLQTALLVVAARWYARRGERVMAACCAIGVVASLTAWWAIAQIRGVLFDHAVFWVTAIGAANWSLVCAFASDRLLPAALDGRPRWLSSASRASARLKEPPHPQPPLPGERGHFARLARAEFHARAALVLGIAGLLLLFAPGAIGILRAARAADGSATSRVAMLADAAAARLDPSTGRKTLLLIQQDAWGDAAGVILQLYKRQLPIVVDPDWISMFGQPLAPGGGPADAHMDKMVFLPRNADLAPGDTLVGCTPGTCLVLR